MTLVQLNVDDNLWKKFKATCTKDITLEKKVISLIEAEISKHNEHDEVAK